MKYINKTIACGIMALSISGCAPTTYYTGGERIQSRDYATPGVVMQANVQRIHSKPSTLDDLMSSLKKQEKELEAKICLDKYQSDINRITQDITNKNYNSAHSRIKNIINATERKTDKCSKDINQSLKNYTYIRYDFVGDKYEVNEKASNNPIQYAVSAISVGMTILNIPNMIFGIKPSDTLVKPTDKKKKRIEYSHHRIIEVNPYRGTEKFIGKK
jgi:hypothetical protein